MKKFYLLVVLICGIFISACGGGGGGGGGSSSSGSLSIAITDAKPALPAGVNHVFVTIDEVSVHASGGNWVSLPLAQTPFTIDLLQFTNGSTTQLVPPVTLQPGHYTQVRLGVQSATVVTDTQQIPAEIPSGNLKTDKNFDFDVTGGGSVALTFDFDLSQSLVAKGSGGYMLKPVLHLVSTAAAATITGSIKAATYGQDTQATIIVTQNGEEYTRLIVDKGSADPTPFSIFWLVPNQSYTVEVQIGSSTVYSETVPAGSLPAGAAYALNGGNPI